jgi:hypothetical protein
MIFQRNFYAKNVKIHTIIKHVEIKKDTPSPPQKIYGRKGKTNMKP